MAIEHVSYSDHLKLVAERDTLQADNAKLREENSKEYQRGRKDEQAAKLDADHSWKDDCAKLRAEVEGLRSVANAVADELEARWGLSIGYKTNVMEYANRLRKAALTSTGGDHDRN